MAYLFKATKMPLFFTSHRSTYFFVGQKVLLLKQCSINDYDISFSFILLF